MYKEMQEMHRGFQGFSVGEFFLIKKICEKKTTAKTL